MSAPEDRAATPPGAGGPLVREALREGWRNTACGATYAVLLLLVATVTLTVLALLDAGGVLAAVQRERHFRDAGAATLVLSAPGGIDGQRCTDLTATGAFTQAGAIREAARTVLPVLPSSPVVTFEATRGALAIVAGRPDDTTTAPGGVMASTALARDVAPSLTGPGSHRAVPLGPTGATMTTTYDWPDDGRPSTLAYALVAPTTTAGTFDQCWATSRSTTDLPRAAIRSALRPDVTDPESVTVTQLNTTLGTSSTAARDMASRPGRFAPWLAGAVTALLVVLVTRMRAITVLTYRDDGTGFAATWLITLAETILWNIPTALATVAATRLVLHPADPHDVSTALRFAARVAAAGTAGALAATAPALAMLWRRPLDVFLRRA